jgi:hypothetical protein
MAVAEFLENVDLEALGLGDSENKVMRYVDHSGSVRREADEGPARPS